MNAKVLKVHSSDNIIVALEDIPQGTVIDFEGNKIRVAETIPQKHKFSEAPIEKGGLIHMYGVTVGMATMEIPKGGLITTQNVTHKAGNYKVEKKAYEWLAPNNERFSTRTFQGYHREDGKVGTRNYWLVIPLVFCENRNIKVIREAMVEQLGYATDRSFSVDTRQLVDLYKNGAGIEAILDAEIIKNASQIRSARLFKNVDGIKFLTHDGGCGGIRQDSETLCRLLAGYITHANVAGATVLSLGCQNAQFKMLEEALKEFDPAFNKPLYILEQQKSRSEREFIEEAVKKTFAGLVKANEMERKPALVSKLCLGLECGGSDGFSGISANPALGYASDLLTSLNGTAILSEFPELNGVEQELIHRCVNEEIAGKFSGLMKSYAKRAEQAGSGFDMNPSPGNIKDGLITDAMKSAGAAKKGGTSPVTDVLDYTEQATKPGLHLLCTPGNDVESTTGLAGSGANIIVFTTGLGTPTGNPISPVIKVSSNSTLAQKMPDLIDINAGTIISGESTVEAKGEEILELIINVASGKVLTKAELLGQDDFIPWKRGISL